MNLALTLDSATRGFSPGQTVAGHVQWDVDSAALQRLELRLYFRTEGRGTTDVGVARRIVFDDVPARGERPFALELPDGPFSCSGKLVSVVWALEVVAFPGERTSAPFEIELAPGGVAIRLADLAPADA